MRKEKMAAEHRLGNLTQEVRELNDKLEYTRVMPVKDKEIVSLESRLEVMKTNFTLPEQK